MQFDHYPQFFTATIFPPLLVFYPDVSSGATNKKSITMETNKHALCLSVVGDVPLKAAGTKHQQRLCRLTIFISFGKYVMDIK